MSDDCVVVMCIWDAQEEEYKGPGQHPPGVLQEELFAPEFGKDQGDGGELKEEEDHDESH